MVNGDTPAGDFGDITVKRGGHRELEHTFAFTADRPGVFSVMPGYFLFYEGGTSRSYEPGYENTIQVTFK